MFFRRSPEQRYRDQLAITVAKEVRSSDIEPGKVAWISVDSGGTVHVADGHESPSGGTASIHFHGVAESMESIKANTNIVLKLVGSAESIR